MAPVSERAGLQWIMIWLVGFMLPNHLESPRIRSLDG